MTKKLLAIDPGLMTGVCLIDISDMDNPVPVWDGEWTVSEFHDRIGYLMSDEDLEVVIENFFITVETGKLSQQPFSLHLIGVVLYLSHLNGVKVTFQKPSQKPFADNDKLRKVGFWSVGAEGHSIDAYRHAMIWIADRNPKWTKKLL